jgi:uncharacterized membrane protein YdjX (TVP38/TMEM64 family)
MNSIQPVDAAAPAPVRSSRGRRIVAIAAAVLAIGAVLYGVRSYAGDFLKEGIPQLGLWIDSLGVWGPVAYAGIYAAGVVLALPGSLLTLLGGALFGLVKGVFTVFIGATVGSSLAFLISRYVARDWVARRLARSAGLARIDRAVGQQGFRIVLLMRLSPVFPFTALNFMLGLTRVRFADYVMASIGMVPGTLLFVYYGRLIGDVAQIAAGVKPPSSWVDTLIFGVGLVAAIVVSVLVARLARRALDSELPQEGA